jgi:hypothetical protein
MLNKFFFAQNIVSGFNVNFTVKKWFLDPEDDFTDTEVGTLQGITVKIIGQSEKVTDVNGQAGFNLPNGTYTYQVYDMDAALTTVQGSITVSGLLAVDVKLYSCLYTPFEIQELIDDESYVPVSTSTELEDLRNTGSRTMGAGTIWAGTYTTGWDKKYLLVKNIDLDYANTIHGLTGAQASGFYGTFDGNGLRMIKAGQSIFRAYGGTYRNINVHGILSGSGLGNEGNLGIMIDIIKGSSLGGNTLIQNCHARGSVTKTGASQFSGCGGLIGYIESTGYSTTVEDSSFDGDVIVQGSNSTNFDSVGGITGMTRLDPVTILRCWAKGSVSNQFRYYNGGIVGYLRVGTVEKCWYNGNITGVQSVGGIVGEMDNSNSILRKSHSYGSVLGTGVFFGGGVGLVRIGNVYDCFSHAAVSKGATGDQLGGFVGRILASQSVNNCYSTGFVTAASGSSIGGFCGLQQGTLTNSYYDTQTSGRSDTGKGLPRTTAQMKAGTASSFILPDGTTDPDNLAANAMYTSWSTAIWDFLTTNDYPILKP